MKQNKSTNRLTISSIKHKMYNIVLILTRIDQELPFNFRNNQYETEQKYKSFNNILNKT